MKKTNKTWIWAFLVLVLVLILVNCGGPSNNVFVPATNTPTATVTPSPTLTSTPTQTPTITPSPTITVTATPLPRDLDETAREFLIKTVNWEVMCVSLVEEEVTTEFSYLLSENQKIAPVYVTRITTDETCVMFVIFNLPDNYVERGFPATDGYFVYKYHEITLIDGKPEYRDGSYARSSEDIIEYRYVSIPSDILESNHFAHFSKE